MSITLRNSRQFRFLTVCTLAAVFSACAGVTEPRPKDREATSLAPRALMWLEHFDRQLDRAAPACADRSNDDGSLSWGGSYLLLALLEAWSATREVRYLDRFILEADKITAWSDRSRGVEDWLGRSTDGWSSTRYSSGNLRAKWIVLDAVVAEPLAAFAVESRANPKLPNRIASAGQAYLDLVKSVVSGWNSTWIDIGEEGAYLMEANFPSSVSDTIASHLPLNQIAAAGLVHWELWRATGDRSHLDRALRIGRRVRSHLVPRENGWTWTYWGRESWERFNTSPEDISHAALSVRLLAKLGGEGHVLSNSDRRRLAQTLISIKDPAGGFYRDVNGTSRDFVTLDPKCGAMYPRTYSDAAPHWSVLQDSLLTIELASFIDARLDATGWQDPVRLLGLAAVARAWPRISAAP
jgi:hypothetical protein